MIGLLIEALFLLNKNRIKRKADDGNKNAKLVYEIVETNISFYKQLIYFSNIAFLTFVGAILLFSFLERPLNIFSYDRVSFAFLLVPVAILVMYALSGLIFTKKIRSKMIYFLERKMDIDPSEIDEDFSENDVRIIVDSGSSKIAESEIKMINNIFEFDDKTTSDIAIHRKDIVAIDINSNIEEIVEILLKVKYSRIPIYQENIDNIIGILHIKDVMDYILEYKSLANFKLQDMIREPFFVPGSKKNDELFKEMQKNKILLAIIVDEYGGTEGLVTMEDLIEEIMGDIFDEHDEEEIPDIEKIKENRYIVKGKTSLDDFNEFFEVTLPLDEYETIGGFMVGQIGHIPDEDERAEIDYDRLKLKVIKTEDKRISTLLVKTV